MCDIVQHTHNFMLQHLPKRGWHFRHPLFGRCRIIAVSASRPPINGTAHSQSTCVTKTWRCQALALFASTLVATVDLFPLRGRAREWRRFHGMEAVENQRQVAVAQLACARLVADPDCL
jgi:hypothetical protein